MKFANTFFSQISSLLRREWIGIGLILLISALAHGINMAGFPFYESDEGTYMSQAWAVARLGQLAPYTYWYDHAPVGWFQLAAWSTLTGGFTTFGTPINSGRVFMLLLQVLSTFMLYRITRRISNSTVAATIAALTFAFSAYGIYYHRRVLLDNMATFWLLLSILLLLEGRSRRTQVWLSAVACGIAILSKEPIVVFLPGLAYLAWFQTSGPEGIRRRQPAAAWVVIAGAVVATYPLMALLRGELFPPGSWPASPDATESLIGTLQFQMSRGKDGGLFDLNSRFWTMASLWVRAEPLLVILGTLSAVASVLLIRQRRLVGIMGVLSLTFWLFLGRGGETLAFYLVPLLPLLALNLGVIAGLVIEGIQTSSAWFARIATRKQRFLPPVVVGLCLIGTLGGYGSPHLGFDDNPLTLWTNNQAHVQAQTVAWVQAHIPPDSLIIIDQSMWTDLHEQSDSGNAYPNAHYYWKVAHDPAIRDDVFGGDWQRVNYIITTPQLVKDAREQDFQVVNAALAHSQPVVTFDTGGWPIEIRHVNPAYPAMPIETIFAESWDDAGSH